MEHLLFSLSYQVDCNVRPIKQNDYPDHLIKRYSQEDLIESVVSLPAPIGGGYNQEYVDLLGITLPKGSELNQTNNKFGPFIVDHVRMTIGYMGFMTVEVYCSLPNGLVAADRLEQIEKGVQVMADFYSKKCDFYDSVISEISNLLIRKTDFYYGRHQSVEESLMKDESFKLSLINDRYIYTYHLFTIDEVFAHEIVSDCCLNVKGLKVGHAYTWMRFGFHLWLLEKKPDISEMERFANSCIIAAWEVLVYDTGAINYKYLLQLIVRNKYSDNDVIRQSINHDNLLITGISSLLRDQGAEELGKINQCREEYHYLFRKDNFEKAQEYLRYATDGIEEKAHSKTSNLMKIVLTILTSMSVYSVTYDGYSLLFSESANIPPNALSSLLFSFATLIMVLITIFTVRHKD